MVRAELDPATSPAAVNVGDLYRDHAATVARWATRLGGPGIDAEDIVHEVFLVAHRRLGEFRGEAKPATWLFRTTELVVRAHRRKARLRAWLRHAIAEEQPAEMQAGSSWISPVENLIERQRARTVYRALDSLDDKHRSLFVLFELEGLSGEEIARLTGVKLATVWVRLHRARQRFVRRIQALALAAEETDTDTDTDNDNDREGKRP
ncbi:MAG TPA: RNA polymerase sigma factor [Polyangia bacterium]|nr:RNA polymerase sigma factor [Polyangia bacterium]